MVKNGGMQWKKEKKPTCGITDFITYEIIEYW